MIATFTWGLFEADFTCNYNHPRHSYTDFGFVNGSMSLELLDAFFDVEGNLGKKPRLEQLAMGWLKFDTAMILEGSCPRRVELWAKKRVDGDQVTPTDDELRELKLGQYASVGEEEKRGKEENDRADCSEENSDTEDESDVEGDDGG